MNDKKQSDFRKTLARLRMALFASAGLKPRDKLVAAVMLDHVNRERYEAAGELVTWIGVQTLADACALSERDVQRARSTLLRVAVVTVERRGGGPRQTTRMQFDPAWSAPAKGDTGVADSCVTLGAELPPESAGIAAKTGGSEVTPVSPKPVKESGIKPGARVGAHARPVASAFPPDSSAEGVPPPFAGHFARHEFQRWLAACAIEVTGDTAVILAPNRLTADWIRVQLDHRLRVALGVESLDVDVVAPPLRPASRSNLAVVGGVG